MNNKNQNRTTLFRIISSKTKILQLTTTINLFLDLTNSKTVQILNKKQTCVQIMNNNMNKRKHKIKYKNKNNKLKINRINKVMM